MLCSGFITNTSWSWQKMNHSFPGAQWLCILYQASLATSCFGVWYSWMIRYYIFAWFWVGKTTISLHECLTSPHIIRKIWIPTRFGIHALIYTVWHCWGFRHPYKCCFELLPTLWSMCSLANTANTKPASIDSVKVQMMTTLYYRKPCSSGWRLTNFSTSLR